MRHLRMKRSQVVSLQEMRAYIARAAECGDEKIDIQQDAASRIYTLDYL